MDDDSRRESDATQRVELSALATDDTSHDLVPMRDESAAQATSFDTVLRGYSKVQVEDYLDRVELALSEADQRHAEDGARFAAYDAELASVNERLALAERRASGQPDPASVVVGRLAEMLALAEREAAETRRAAKEDADRTLTDIKHRAELDNQERTKALEAREAEVAEAKDSIDKLRIEAQTDADQLRATSRREAAELVSSAQAQAEALLSTAKAQADALVDDAASRAETLRVQAEEDVRIAHEDARQQRVAEVEAAQIQVDSLVAQRDAVARELRGLTDKLNAIGASIGQISGS